MRLEVEQELAHTLLVELLAYQFASPVRWIETQDAMLTQKKAERVIEIGPTNTLSVMAKRTLASKYEAYDAARTNQRQILCYSDDTREIYYDEDPAEQKPQPTETAPTIAPPLTHTSMSAVVESPSSEIAVAQFPDEPVVAIDIVRTLVAHKLKKAVHDIPLSKSIKDLVGGKSTLQNEILGDVNKEFGSAPDKAEDMPLDELGGVFQSTFDGQLGKQSQSLIARLISSKMPGGFNITAARKHLETRWGLGVGRRDAVLLLALTLEPSSRLASESDARAFLDSVAQKYASNSGIDLSSASKTGHGTHSDKVMLIDPEAINALTKDQKLLYQQQLELTARYLNIDLRAGDKSFAASKDSTKVLQNQLDLWIAEHGEDYAAGFEPVFSRPKVRTYDSSWNWAREDVLQLYFDLVLGGLQMNDHETASRFIQVMNRSNPSLLKFVEYQMDHRLKEKGAAHLLAKEFGKQLINNCRDELDKSPMFKDVAIPTGPRTTIDERGHIKYQEVPRANCENMELYVQQLVGSDKICRIGDVTEAQSDSESIQELMRQYYEKNTVSQPDSEAFVTGKMKDEVQDFPFLQLKTKTIDGWTHNERLTALYLASLEHTAKFGTTFQNQYVLVTGSGSGSIGAEVLRGLISGGAKVVVTTSRFSRKVNEYYQALYARYGSRGSELHVVPFNQGSKLDVVSLVEYIYDEKAGLGWDLDHIVPFAAISENGRQIDDIDSKSELAHRVMLTNLLRLLGCIKAQKSQRGFKTRPAQVVLPLSPNHGTFGNDGLYSESKLALETLFNRWHSESWGSYLTVCGAVIGWTRGTGLMASNNIVAEGIESIGVRTFSQKEMAFNILGLMSPMIVDLCQSEPVFADLGGGLQSVPNLKETVNNLRNSVTEASEVRQAVSDEQLIDERIVHGPDQANGVKKLVEPRPNIKLGFPSLPDWKKDIAPHHEDLKGMVDLESVVVFTGFGEVGPWGGSRTRWEMEAYGEFSIEGCIEMAWIMGLIKNHNGPLHGKPYAGWIDVKTGEPVDDKDVKPKYEKYILEHAGIRLIDPDLFGGYDPNRKQLLQEVLIGEDLEPFEASKETAEQFKLAHGDMVEIFEIPESGEYCVRVKKGASLWIPKALRFDRLVAGQIPTGWDARRYGIPDDIATQVDPVTLYLLVSISETLISCGITDPYEFYKYVHISEVGNCVGSGMGGQAALRKMHKDRFVDKPVQSDIFQEAFVNTMPAWVNMLLLSSSGPIKTPSGACATAVESLDIGFETILDGKARICFVGGLDDFGEDGSYEFGNMGATSNTLDEFAQGRTPQEMSRPAASTRNGFMESHGCGTQIIMTAKLALEMGVPIYGVVALTATASDKIGRSVPAPGKGVLTAARERVSKFPNSLLDIHYRRRQIEQRKKQIESWKEAELEDLYDQVAVMKAQGVPDCSSFLQYNIQHIQKEATRQTDGLLQSMGNHFWREDPSIAPIRGALAVWGLTIDDLDVASFHGTSTKINEKNESFVIHEQLQHLGRKDGNAIMGVFQKHLTGHPKGAAGAWMLNGCLQVLNTGLVPGNRNADNIDSELEQFDSIVFPHNNIQTDGIKAFSVTSFGFGQKGAQAIGVHPKYLFAALDEHSYNEYCAKVVAREMKVSRYFHNGFIKNSLFATKADSPYSDDQLGDILLNPNARVHEDRTSAELRY